MPLTNVYEMNTRAPDKVRKLILVDSTYVICSPNFMFEYLL